MGNGVHLHRFCQIQDRFPPKCQTHCANYFISWIPFQRQKALSGHSPSPVPQNPPSGFSYRPSPLSSSVPSLISQLSAFLATPSPCCPSLLAWALLTGGLFQHLWAELWFGAFRVTPDPHTSRGWVGRGLESRLSDTQKGTEAPQLWGQSCEGVLGRLCSLLTRVPVPTTHCETWGQPLGLSELGAHGSG